MPFRRAAETGDLETLHREGFDDSHTADGLLEQSGHVRHPLLRTVRRASEAFAEMNDWIDEQRRGDKGDQRELWIRPEDVDQEREKRKRFLEEIAHTRRYRGL